MGYTTAVVKVPWIALQNCVPLKRNEENLTLSVSYPLRLWVAYRESEDRQASIEKDVVNEVWFLRFFLPHLSQVLGKEAGAFYTKHVIQVAQAEGNLDSFTKEKRLEWRKKQKRPTFYEFSVSMEDRELDCPPVLVHKYNFKDSCITENQAHLF